MTRPKFTHELGGSSGPPAWVKRDDKQLVVRKTQDDGTEDVERWNYYLEQSEEDGKMWPALPPSARDEANSMAEEKRPDHAGGGN